MSSIIDKYGTQLIDKTKQQSETYIKNQLDSFNNDLLAYNELKSQGASFDFQSGAAKLAKKLDVIKDYISDSEYNTLRDSFIKDQSAINARNIYRDIKQYQQKQNQIANNDISSSITETITEAMKSDSMTAKDLLELQQIQLSNHDLVSNSTISKSAKHLLGQSTGNYETDNLVYLNDLLAKAKESGNESAIEQINAAVESKEKAVSVKNAKYLSEYMKTPLLLRLMNNFQSAFENNAVVRDFYNKNLKKSIIDNPYTIMDSIRQKIKSGEDITSSEAQFVFSDINRNQYFSTQLTENELKDYYIKHKSFFNSNQSAKLAFNEYIKNYSEYNPESRSNSYTAAKAYSESKGASHELNALASDDLDNYAEIGEEKATDAEKKSTDYMTLTQKSVYYYYIGKGEHQKAYEYKNAITEELNYKEANAWITDANALKKTGITLVSGLENFCDGVLGQAAMLDDNLHKTSSVTPELKAAIATDSVISSAAAQIIEGSGTWGKTWYTAIQSLGQQAPMIALSFANPAMGLSTEAMQILQGSMMYATASGSAYIQEVKQNRAENRAAVYAAINGALEVGVEKAIGGMYKWGGGSKLASTLMGKILNSMLNKGFSDVTMAIFGAATYKLASAGSEGIEEYIQEVIDPLVKNLVYNEDNEVSLFSEDALIAFLSGGLSSFLLGATDIRSTYRQSLVGSSIRSNANGISGLIQNAENMLNNSDVSVDVKETIESMLETVKEKQKNSSNIELGQLQETVQIAMRESIGKNVEQILNDLKIDIEEAKVMVQNKSDLSNEGTQLNAVLQAIESGEYKNSVDDITQNVDNGSKSNIINNKEITEGGIYNGEQYNRENEAETGGYAGIQGRQAGTQIDTWLEMPISELDGRENYRGAGIRSLSESIKNNLRKQNKTPIDFKSSESPASFYAAIGRAKNNNPHGAYVAQHTVDEYSNMLLLTSEDENVGVAVKSNGDIVSVFKNSDSHAKGAVSSILLNAIENGGIKLDNFDGGLSDMYTQHGFIPVARTAFVDEFAPDDWNYERDGRPDIVFWIHNGETAEQVAENIGTYDILKTLDDVPMFDSYDEAAAYRDSLIEVNKTADDYKGISVPDTTPVEENEFDEIVRRMDGREAPLSEGQQNIESANSNVTNDVGFDIDNADTDESITGITQPDLSDKSTAEEKLLNDANGIPFTYKAEHVYCENVSEALGIKLNWDINAEANGFYEKGEITLNPYAADPLLQIFKHEFTHYLESSPWYGSFVTYVKGTSVYQNWVEAKGGEAALIDNITDRYKKHGKQCEPMHEIIADFIAENTLGGVPQYKQSETGFLNTEGGVADEIIKFAQDNRHWYDAILTHIKNIIVKIKNAFGKYAKGTYRDLADSNTKELNEIYRRLVQMKYTVNMDKASKGDVQYSYGRKNLDRKGKTAYNEFNTIAMQWANSSDIEQGEVKRLFNNNSKKWCLIIADENSDGGYYILGTGTYEEVRAEYDRYIEEDTNAFSKDIAAYKAFQGKYNSSMREHSEQRSGRQYSLGNRENGTGFAAAADAEHVRTSNQETSTEADLNEESAFSMPENNTSANTPEYSFSDNESRDRQRGEEGYLTLAQETETDGYNGIFVPDTTPVEENEFDEIVRRMDGREAPLSEGQQYIMSVGKALGLTNVEFIDTAKGGITKAGNKFVATNDGFIDKDGTVYINSKASGSAALKVIFTHEITHFAEKNPGQYKKYAEAVFNSKTFEKWMLSKANGRSHSVRVEKYRQSIIDRYAEHGVDFRDSNKEANAEIIAEFTSEMLFNEKNNTLERLVSEVNQKDRNAVFQFIHDFISWLKTALKGEKISFDIVKLENHFASVLRNAETKYGQKNNTANDSDVKYSVGYTTDNKPVVVVNDDIISNATNNKDAISIVKRYLGRFKKVLINGQTIHFIRDTKNEYTSSRYSQWLSRNNPQVFNDKMRVAGHPQDIVYATTNYINEGLKHNRKDNIVDFARGNILLDVSGRQYIAEVVMGFTNKGICELHDIVSLNPTSFKYKKIESASMLIDTNNVSSRSDAPSLDPTIPQNDTGSQDYYMQNSENDASNNNLQYSFSDNESRDVQLDNGGIAVAERNQTDNTSLDYSEVDADGNEMTKAQSDYFSKSKARDKNGSLYVVYHGTESEDFYEFDRARQGQTDYGSWGKGFYFDRIKDTAEMYGPNVRAFYLNITNPYRFSSFMEGSGRIARYLIKNGYKLDFDYKQTDAFEFVEKFGSGRFTEAMQNLGHDGVIIGNTEFVAFDENQAKLTNNQNPTESNDIRYSFRDSESDYGFDKAGDNKITAGMTDSERAEILKNVSLNVVRLDEKNTELSSEKALSLKNTYKSKASNILKELAEKFGIFKSYSNDKVELEFNYSKGSLYESVHKQNERNANFYDFAKMLYVFDDVVSNAVPIECHKDKYVGTKRENKHLNQVFVLLSAFSESNSDTIVPVEFNIKEYNDGTANKLYVSVTLTKIEADLMEGRTETNPKNPSKSTSIYSIYDLIKNINSQNADFLRYIPDEMLNSEQIQSKRQSLDKENERLNTMRGESVSNISTSKGYAENVSNSAVNDTASTDLTDVTADQETETDGYNGISVPDTTPVEENEFDEIVRRMDGREAPLSEGQQYIRSVGKALGLTNVEFIDTAKGGITKAGNKFVATNDGFIDKDGTVYINSKASGSAALKVIFTHEITHFAEKNPEQYKKYAEAVFNSKTFEKWMLSKANGRSHSVRVEKYRQSIIDRYAEHGVDFRDSNKEANAEIIAEFTSEMLFNEKNNTLERLVSEVNQKDRSAVFQFIHDFISWLKTALKGEKISFDIVKLENHFAFVLRNSETKYGQKNNTANDSDVKYSFAQETSESAVSQAETLEKQGKDRDEIWRELGLIRDASGIWVYEIDDSGMQIFPNGDAYGANSSGKLLSDFVKHDELFKKYPQIADAGFEFKDLSDDKGCKGYYDNESNKIVLDNSLRFDIEDKELSISAIHEIQHIIQEIDGRAGGANTKYWLLKLRQNAINKFNESVEPIKKRVPKKIFRNIQSYALFRQLGKSGEQYLSLIKESGYLNELNEYYKLFTEYNKELDSINNGKNYTYYYFTAGEIESRQTGKRFDMTAEERRDNTPDLGWDNAVFADNEVSYSIANDNDGENIVVIDTDQGLFVGVDESEYRRIAKDYLNDHFKNTVLPLSDYGLVSVNKTGIGKYTYSGKNIENSANNAKMKAATELDNLLRTAEYIKSTGDRKNHNFAAYGFDYYRTRFIVDGRVFEGVIDIGVSEKGAEFYGMTNIENVTSRYYGKYSNLLLGYKSVTQSDISNSRIPQGNSTVKNNISGKSENDASNNNLQYSFSDNESRDVQLDNGGIAVAERNQNPTESNDIRYSFGDDSIDKPNNMNNNISRANKQGELINEFYNALNKNEWHLFYQKIANHGYLEKTEVGDIISVSVGGKLVIAERQMKGTDAHDFQLVDVYQENNGDSFITNEIADIINESVGVYDQRGIQTAISEFNKKYDETAVLRRYDSEYRKFVDSSYYSRNRYSSSSTDRGYNGRTDRERISSPVKQNMERSEADSLESAFSMPENDNLQYSISDEENNNRSFGDTVNDLSIRFMNEDNIIKELQELYNYTGGTAIIPEKAPKSFTVNGERVYLDADKYAEFNKLQGEKAKELIIGLMNSQSYKAMTWEKKAAAVVEAYSYALALAKTEVSDYELKESKHIKWKQYEDIGLDIAELIALQVADKDSDGSGSVSKDEYAYAVNNSYLSDSEKELLVGLNETSGYDDYSAKKTGAWAAGKWYKKVGGEYVEITDSAEFFKMRENGTTTYQYTGKKTDEIDELWKAYRGY